MSDITQKEINQVNTIKGFLLDGHHYISYIGKRLASDFRTNLSSSIDCVTKDLAEKDQQLAAAKTEIEKLSPLVDIVSNQKQRIQQLEEDLLQVRSASKRYIDRNEKRKDK